MSFTVLHSLTDEAYADAFPESDKNAAIAFAKDISRRIPYAVFVFQDTTAVMVALHGSVSPAGDNPYDTARSMRNRQNEGEKEKAKVPPMSVSAPKRKR